MTPEEARALLDGTTPGPWFFDDDMAGTVHTIGPIVPCGNELDCTTDDAALAAAAPTLAAMVAGMSTEYMALNRADEDGEWHQVTPWSPEWPFRTGHVPDPRFDKVIRRYVTTEEKIE